MNFSFSTIFTAILTSNLLLILLTLLLRNSRIMITAGYKIFIFVILLVSLRILVPFEFPFAKNVYFSELPSKIIANIQHHYIEIHGYLFSLWDFFGIIWIAGMIVYMIYFIHAYYQFKKDILLYGINITHQEKYSTILDKICKDHHSKNNFQVYLLRYINIPMIFGIHKPYILIPETLETTPKELYYILSHETAHYFYHDLTVKFLVQILCIIYWWNPACILLKKQSDLLLEMRVDEHVAASGTIFRKEYLECILRILKDTVRTKNNMFTISLCGENETVLIQRFRMMTDMKTVKHRYLLNTGLFLIAVAMYSLSYLFILEADYILPEIAETTKELSPDNTYLIRNLDGTYNVYFNQLYIETVNSLDMYQDNYPIYQSITEANKK